MGMNKDLPREEQFFQYGLNTEHLTNDYIINVYKQKRNDERDRQA